MENTHPLRSNSAEAHTFSKNVDNFDKTAYCAVVCKQRNYDGAEKLPFGMVQSISANQWFNLDITETFGEAHTVSAMRKAN